MIVVQTDTIGEQTHFFQDFCYNCIGNTLLIQDFLEESLNRASRKESFYLDFSNLTFFFYTYNDVLDVIHAVDDPSVKRRLNQKCQREEVFQQMVIQTIDHNPHRAIAVFCLRPSGELVLYPLL